MEELKNKLAAPNLPEQLFGGSLLRLTHCASGLTLEFSAADALRQWQEDDEPPVQVCQPAQPHAAVRSLRKLALSALRKSLYM